MHRVIYLKVVHTRQTNIDVTMFTDLTIDQDSVPTISLGSERLIRKKAFTLVVQPLVETSNLTTEGRTVSPCQQLSNFLSWCCCWSISSKPISPMSNAPQPAAI